MNRMLLLAIGVVAVASMAASMALTGCLAPGVNCGFCGICNQDGTCDCPDFTQGDLCEFQNPATVLDVTGRNLSASKSFLFTKRKEKLACKCGGTCARNKVVLLIEFQH